MATPVWSPCDTLRVDPDAMGFTCVGYAPSQGRRCHNPIAIANRHAASHLLNSVAFIDPSQVAALQVRFKQLAPMVLCKRNHQGQAQDVVGKWLSEVQRLNHGPVLSSPTRVQTPRPHVTLGVPRQVSWTSASVLPPAAPLPATPQQRFIVAGPQRGSYTLVSVQATRTSPAPQSPLDTSNLPGRRLALPPIPTANSRASPQQTTVITQSQPLQIPPPLSQALSASPSPERLVTTSRIPRFNPYDTFSVNPNSRYFSCVGHSTREHGRCSKSISTAHRDTACDLLDRIASRPLSMGRLESLLERLAPVVLCRRHQRQGGGMVEKWIADVEDMLTRREAEEPVEEGRGGNNPSRDRRRAAEAEESSEDGDSSESDGNGSYDNSGDDNGSEGNGGNSNGDYHDGGEEGVGGDTLSISLPEHSAAIPPPAPTPPILAPVPSPIFPSTILSTPPRSNTSSSTSTNPAAIRLPTPSSTVYSTPSTRPQSPTRHRTQAVRKPIEGECPICYSLHETISLADIVWCQTQCGRNFCRECIEIWKNETAERRVTTTCPTCRADWVS